MRAYSHDIFCGRTLMQKWLDLIYIHVTEKSNWMDKYNPLQLVKKAWKRTSINK